MKLLFTDLDGTLLNNNSQVSPGSKAFLERFLADGNKLLLSSGRPLPSVQEVLRTSGLPSAGVLLICNNGTLVYDCDSDRNIMEKRLPLSSVAYLQEQARIHGVHVQTYTDEAVICEKEDDEIRYYRRKIHVPLILTDDFVSVLPKEPFKMLAASLTDHEKLVRFSKSLAPWAKGRIQAIFSNDKYLELFREDAGKENAVRFVCDYFNIPLKDAYAAGDAENDISMLEIAGTGIAMKNATDEVKKAADVITELDNDNDGLVHMLEKLLAQG